MLKLKYLMEDFDLARDALSHWDHDESTLAERLKWFRISASAVYPFDDVQGNLCFLRLIPAAEKSATEILAELDFLTYLQEKGYPCMRPIAAKGDLLLVPLNWQGENWYACAFTGVPGQPLDDLPMNSMLAHAYGYALGRLHAASMGYRPMPTCRSRERVTRWIAETLAACGAPETIRAKLDEVVALLDEKPRSKMNYGLVHYDFEPDNVFWDGSGCHAIDFGDAMMHFYAMDLVQALDEMEEEFYAPFIGGYHDGCPESGMEQADFPLMRRFRDLYAYARLLHSLSEKPELQPEWMVQLVSRLENRRDELQRRICEA